MPELPEVETIKRALEPIIVGRKVARVVTKTHTLRYPLDENKLNITLKNATFTSVKRRGKYLFFGMSNEVVILSHLGMTGSFRIEPTAKDLLKHDRIVIELDHDESLIYNDIRKFGEFRIAEIVKGKEFPERFDRYAPEPLSKAFNKAYLIETLAKSKSPVKVAIMNQELVVGVGNIYASEALFESKISPLRPANSLTEKECTLLVKKIKDVLLRSLESGGTTISDYRKPDGSEGKFVLRLKVYGRGGEKCKRRGCDGDILKITQTGRSTFYCEECQN